MQKRFCVLLFTACGLWAMVITLFVAACSSGSGGNEEQSDGTVKLVLGKLQVPLFDSISVCVTATDMKTLHVSASSVNDNVKIEGIPLGENRKFEVKVYADGGKEVLKGEAAADIIANQTVTISISLTALYGFLRIEVPLGLTNSANIHSGILSLLDSLEFPMQFEAGKGIFNTGALPLNQTFTLNLELMDSTGYPLFLGEKQITLLSITQTETIQLQSNTGSAVLELEASLDGPMQILAMLPSTSRPPENYGDLFFTEIFVYGTGTEYMEIYNATLDTLELSGCRIARSKSETSATNRVLMSSMSDIPKNLILPPMEYLLLGLDGVTNADFNYKSFVLTDAGQDLGFFCADSVIDFLHYSKDKDNPFPLSQGKAMQLPLSNFADRANGTSWCSGSSPKQDASCP